QFTQAVDGPVERPGLEETRGSRQGGGDGIDRGEGVARRFAAQGFQPLAPLGQALKGRGALIVQGGVGGGHGLADLAPAGQANLIGDGRAHLEQARLGLLFGAHRATLCGFISMSMSDWSMLGSSATPTWAD